MTLTESPFDNTSKRIEQPRQFDSLKHYLLHRRPLHLPLPQVSTNWE
jgi:hypothetical protein